MQFKAMSDKTKNKFIGTMHDARVVIAGMPIHIFMQT
jgi:hypothetical protein